MGSSGEGVDRVFIRNGGEVVMRRMQVYEWFSSPLREGISEGQYGWMVGDWGGGRIQGY